MDMDDFDSPQAVAEMRHRHLRIALEMQRLAACGLSELRERGNLTADECAELLHAGMKLESAAAPNASRKRQ